MNKKYKKYDDEVDDDDDEQDDEVLKERRKHRIKNKKKFSRTKKKINLPKISGFKKKRPRQRNWEVDDDFDFTEDF